MTKKKNVATAGADIDAAPGIPEGQEDRHGAVDDSKRPGEPNRPQFSNPGEVSVAARETKEVETPAGNIRVDF